MASKLLWVSPMAPFDGVKHAGGKTHNFYTKSFGLDDRFDVTLLTCCLSEEEETVKLEFADRGIATELVVQSQSKARRLLWRALNAETVLNPFNRYAGLTRNSHVILVKRRTRRLWRSGYRPELIVLHWTHMNLLASWFKKLFPDSKLIEIEVDFVYQSYCRHTELECRWLHKAIWRHKTEKMHRLELASLSLADTVIVNNPKDMELISSMGVTQPIFQWKPYYQSMIGIQRVYAPGANRDVIFYGAMNREENWRSVIWFIEHVMPLLKERQVCLRVIGGRPIERLKRYESDSVHVEGYVDDIGSIFSSAMCMVAPLLLGAGIKVKVIEGLSAGIPVLTNQIGIEGIPAENGKNYIHCETAEEYRDAIVQIIEGSVDVDAMAQMSKRFIQAQYNYADDAVRLKRYIADMLNDQSVVKIQMK